MIEGITEISVRGPGLRSRTYRVADGDKIMGEFVQTELTGTGPGTGVPAEPVAYYTFTVVPKEGN